MYTIKKYIQISILSIFMFVVSLEAAPLMSLAQPAIEPSPLESIENNGEGNISFLMSERNDVEVSGDNRFKVAVVMSKVKLKNADITGIKVEDARNSNVDVTNKFDLTYLPDDKMVILQQKETEPLPGNMRYLVIIPIEVTVNSPVSNPDNGFLVNMNSEGDAVANGDSSDYTYTLSIIDAVDDSKDSIPGNTGGVAIANITSNDTLDGSSVTLGTDVNITNITDTTPYLNIDAITGEATVPANTPAGTYTETYTLCEVLNPTNCEDAIVSVTVIATPINADNDNGGPVNGLVGGIGIVDIIGNDTLDGNTFVLGTDVNITNVTNDTPLVVNSITGQVTVPSNTPFGPYVETYTICENLNPTNCDTAEITVMVLAAPLDAVDDTNASAPGTGGVVIADVTDNDTLDGNPITLGTDANITEVTDLTPNLDINLITGEATVPANTPAGTYTEVYTLCEILNPTKCEDATVTVTVIAAPIDAVNDSKDSIPGNTGGEAIENITSNDTLDGNSVTLGTDVTIDSVTNTTPLVINLTTGQTTVPANTPAGTYTETYTLCEVLNPTNCEDATVTVTVVASLINAVNDENNSVPRIGGVVISDVTDNDTFNGERAILGTDVNITNVTMITPYLDIDTITGEATVSVNTPAGTYSETYTLCEILNPTNCEDATVTVTVIAAPIDAVNDSKDSIPGNTGGEAIENITSNDTLDGNSVTLGTDVTIDSVTNTTPLVINLTTGQTTVPANTPAGTYTETYTLCEVLNPTNCEDATVTVTVVIAPIDAVNDITDFVLENTDGEAIEDITLNDTLDGNSVTLGTDVTIDSVTNITPLVVDLGTGSVTVPAGTAAGIYTETYTLCEVLNPTNCDDANITVTVISNPDYKPVLTVYGGIVTGVGIHPFSFDTLVRNLKADTIYDISKPLKIIIPKNEALTLTYDSSMTLFKGQTVENNLWSFDDSDPFDYIMTYIGSEIPTNRSRFSLQGTLEVELGEVGKFFLETTILSGTGGDSVIDNNSDRETLEKRLQ